MLRRTIFRMPHPMAPRQARTRLKCGTLAFVVSHDFAPAERHRRAVPPPPGAARELRRDNSAHWARNGCSSRAGHGGGEQGCRRYSVAKVRSDAAHRPELLHVAIRAVPSCCEWRYARAGNARSASLLSLLRASSDTREGSPLHSASDCSGAGRKGEALRRLSLESAIPCNQSPRHFHLARAPLDCIRRSAPPAPRPAQLSST